MPPIRKRSFAPRLYLGNRLLCRLNNSNLQVWVVGVVLCAVRLRGSGWLADRGEVGGGGSFVGSVVAKREGVGF